MIELVIKAFGSGWRRLGFKTPTGMCTKGLQNKLTYLIFLAGFRPVELKALLIMDL